MDYQQQWREELELLKSIISKFPFEKTVKWGADVFTYNGKNVVSCYGFKNHFTLWFYNGVFLTDKNNHLIAASEGKTKSLRQWRFTSKDQIDEKEIMSYIEEAIEVEKKGLKIKPTKTPVPPIPMELQVALDANPILKEQFQQLTPGYQKEYILYIDEAKQEKTQLARIEKITPMILERKGLKDKYKNNGKN